MGLLNIIKEAATKNYVDEEGDPSPIQLEPPMSDPEIDVLAATLVAPMPEEVRELLRFCRGVDWSLGSSPIDVIDFSGKSCSFEYVEAFPYGHPIAHDSTGNFWVVDLLPGSKDWGPIYYACHDAPIILYQSPTLENFLTEVFKMGVAGQSNLIESVYDDRPFNVWTKNPGAMSYDECAGSTDPELQAFAEKLSAGYQVIDMRNPAIGMGFTCRWDVRRFGEKRLFAYKRPVGLLQRMFGKGK